MIQLFANDAPITTETLTALKTVETVNKAGTMTIGLPPSHSARAAILAPRTVITLKEDGETQFRGRVLSPQTVTDMQQTITCEGELAFLQDTYVPQSFGTFSNAAQLMEILLDQHNANAVETQLSLGRLYAPLNGMPVSVACSEPYVSVLHIFSGIAESITADGIYLTAQDGVVSLAQSLRSTQSIRYGENLISLTRTEDRSDFCTVLYADGTGSDGTTYTLYSVQSQPYIKDDDAVAQYGWIAKYQHFDNVESASELLTKARAYLNRHKSPANSVQIKAFDLHWKKRAVPRFRAGDSVSVYSEPHSYSTAVYLQSVTCDWLNPSANVIEIGRQNRLV